MKSIRRKRNHQDKEEKKVIQNAKNREIEKVNTQTALLAHTRVHKTSKTNQDTERINEATEKEHSANEMSLFLLPQAKQSIQMKLTSKHKTVHTEPLLGDPLPGSQATLGTQGQKPGIGKVGIYGFLIEGESNPPD